MYKKSQNHLIKYFVFIGTCIILNCKLFSQKLPVHPFLNKYDTQCCETDHHQNLINPYGLKFQNPKHVYQNMSAEGLTMDTIQYVGDSENTYDLVILAEGYTAAEIPKFKADAKKVKDILGKNDVYAKLLPKINIFSVGTISQESGISLRKNFPLPTDPIQTEKIKNTYFGVHFLNSYRAYILDDSSTYKARNLASEMLPFSDNVLIIANDEDHSSGRARFEGVALATRFKSTDSIWSNYLVNHELAHSIGNLGDEYQPSKLISFNQDITNDPSKIRWKDLLHLPGVKIDSVISGAYIPNLECMMAFGAGHYTCPVCTKRLKEVIEEPKKLGNPHRIILEKFDASKKTITYKWDSVSSATEYEVVFNATWRNDYIVKKTNENKITFELTDADILAIPSWRIAIQIRAYNANSSSKYEYHKTSIYAHTTLSIPVVKKVNKISDTGYKLIFESKEKAVKINWIKLYNEDGIHSDILTYKDSVIFNNLKKDKKYFFQIASTFPEESSDYFSSPFSQIFPLIDICASNQPKPLSGQQFEYCLNSPNPSINIKAEEGNSLLWYLTDTSTQSSVNPPIILSNKTGISNYYVSQTNSLGCESLKTMISVKINDNPPLPTIENKEYCQNATPLPLKATGNPGNQILWYTTPTSNTGSNQPPPVSTTIAGNTQYFVSQKNEQGCESQRATLNIKIEALPKAPTVENIDLCQFAPVVPINVNFDINNELRWYQTIISTNSSGVIPSYSTQIYGIPISYFVSQKSKSGCESQKTELKINIKYTPEAPFVHHQKEICQNDQDASPLRVDHNPTSKILWYTDTTKSGSTQIPVISTDKVEQYRFFVTETANTGCESAKTEVNVKIKPTPSIPTLTIVNNNEIQSSAKSNLWYWNNTILTDTGQIIKPRFSGNYAAESILDQCKSKRSQAVNFMITSLEEELSSQIVIKPNPFSNYLIIEFAHNIGKMERIDFITITGETLKSVYQIDSGQRLELGEIPNGLYLVRLHLGNKVSTFKKIIKSE